TANNLGSSWQENLEQTSGRLINSCVAQPGSDGFTNRIIETNSVIGSLNNDTRGSQRVYDLKVRDVYWTANCTNNGVRPFIGRRSESTAKNVYIVAFRNFAKLRVSSARPSVANHSAWLQRQSPLRRHVAACGDWSSKDKLVLGSTA